MTAAEILLDELRRSRTTRGLNQEEFGRLISYSGTHVSAVETGSRPPTTDYAAAIDRALRTGGIFGRLLDRLSVLDMAPPWLREWISVEEQATALRWYEPAFVPGLLQTEAYARAILHAGGQLTVEQMDQRVRSRIERQAILNQGNPPRLVAVLDAAVLRRTANDDRAIMREQLAHLAAAAELPHVRIHVVPEETGLYPGLQGGFILASMPDDSTLGHTDNQVRSETVSGAAEIATLERTWEIVVRDALPRKLSLALIKEAALTWT
ncbi:helix-turn-helix transcriptional regulator [Micromonospora sp. WMMD975]|uniref:helix-turn-helix domain-containing protein n=1 Tax=Micromonospora sp. WMMD975 TaxID=3016087 RepID=UPI00249B1F4E|nr:helix-turn-helix transcriptional regulator [Micromonospora sp. WMMD975]WFE36621.1 helix-turn-helix transcriptional regulator [Micromonospora sp. WMMD975]